jgi:hypothetical protein
MAGQGLYETQIENLVGKVYRLLNGLAGRHHPHVHLPLSCQPNPVHVLPLKTSAENVRIFSVRSTTESRIVLEISVVSKMVSRGNPHE